MLVFCCSFRNSSHQSRVRRRVLRWFRTRETDTQPTGRAHVERLNPYVFPTFSGSLPRPAGRLGRHDPAQPRRAAAEATEPLAQSQESREGHSAWKSRGFPWVDELSCGSGAILFFFASKERFILIAHNRITIMGNSLLNTTRKAIAPHCTMVQSLC